MPTKDEIKEAIKRTIALHQYAIDNNISYYDAKAQVNGCECYLCETAQASDKYGYISYGDDGDEACADCPWMVFEGHLCEDEEENNPDYAGEGDCYYKYEKNEDSLIRLNRWLTLLEDSKHYPH